MRSSVRPSRNASRSIRCYAIGGIELTFRFYGYQTGEVSGTGFFIYAMAWGVNNGLLQKDKYAPITKRGWVGMLKQVHQDGRLGLIQPIGAAPGQLQSGSSWVYRVGSFLLAGSEIDKMASAQ